MQRAPKWRDRENSGVERGAHHWVSMRDTFSAGLLGVVMVGAVGGCSKQDEAKAPSEPAAVTREEAKAPTPSPAELRTRFKPIFGTLPEVVEADDNPLTEPKIALGRMLYFETRLSKAHDLSCNSCHALDAYGVDVRETDGPRRTSAGHKQQFGDRNTPTVYNAALHIAQFWDGREPTVEAQAKGPILNPVEMAMADAAHVIRVLKSIPGYHDAFKAAFPEEKDPITYDNVGKAIGAFERKLITPAPFDAFLAGDDNALTADQLQGLQLFVDTGCVACHGGPAIGGQSFMKMGLLKPFATEDLGRFKVTQNDGDKHVFKVPGLRNIAKTGPYLHDGSVDALEDAIQLMAEYQTPRGKLKEEEVKAIAGFLESLTGKLPTEYIQPPELPPSGPKTPTPDAS